LDEAVAQEPEAKVIGYVSAIAEDPRDQIPKEFRGYLDIMGQEVAEALPTHRPYDCKIDLKEGEIAPWGPIYPLSEYELQTLREWLREMLRTGKIRRSTSPAGSPILFIPKPNGKGLRLGIDYRALNRITIPNRYPLPLIQEPQDRVQGSRWFTKLDLKNGFNLIRIREGDEWKTAFRTRYGLYEFQVIPFGLTNAPSTFQDMMNHVFSDMIDLGLLVYMDDFLIYAKTEEEHDQWVKEVLRRLQENRLAVSPDKYLWKTQEVEFLGYVIGQEGIQMAKGKVEAVLNWKTPASLTEVQSFLGFANFYRRFIKDYSRVARPLTELTKVGRREWEWNPQAEEAFWELKRRFTMAPILAHFDATKMVIIETDASDFAIGTILSQKDEEGRLYPVPFHSRKFQPAEINYEIQDKELLAIVDAFKHWCRSAKGQRTRSRCLAITRTSSTSQPQRYSSDAKHDGHRNWPASTSASTTDQETETGNQTLFQGVRTTALKRGGVKTSRSRQFCGKVTSRNQTLRNPTDEEERSSALRQGWHHSNHNHGRKNSRKQSKRQKRRTSNIKTR